MKGAATTRLGGLACSSIPRLAATNDSQSTTNDMDDTTSTIDGSPAGTTASNGTKRKRGNEVKYYAVRFGHQPGVYHTWTDCLDQVKGFKKATCEFGS